MHLSHSAGRLVLESLYWLRDGKLGCGNTNRELNLIAYYHFEIFLSFSSCLDLFHAEKMFRAVFYYFFSMELNMICRVIGRICNMSIRAHMVCLS